MARTALVIEAPASTVLGRLRAELASDAAAGVPPHLTILFPFVPIEDLDRTAVRTLGRVVGGFTRFDYVLDRTAWFGDEVLWLAPSPAGSFLALTEAVRDAFPLYPPYAGLHDAVAPHVTVGDSGSPFEFHRAEESIRAEPSRAEPPIEGAATQVALLAETANGSWRRAMTFSLAPAAP